jgi:alpha-1,3-mannosyltransferase
MRVVHLCRVAPPDIGGMEATIAGLAAQQRREGWGVRIVTLERGGGAPGVVELERVGPRRYPMARGLRRAIAGADVVHVHGVDGLADQVLGMARRPPVAVSTHGGFLHTRRQWWLKQAWLRSVTRVSLARADAIWFTSESDRRRLAPGIPRGRVVANGVHLRDLLDSPRHPCAHRHLVFGRIDVHKGLPRLLDALAALAALRPVTLDVVGDEAQPGLVDLLRAHAARLGLDVCFHGAVSRSRLREMLARTAAAWFPSHAEGFGLTLVEALAAGVPVVAHRLPAYVTKIDARSGLLVDFSDADAVARAAAGFLDGNTPWTEADARAAGARWGWDARWADWRAAYLELRR